MSIGFYSALTCGPGGARGRQAASAGRTRGNFAHHICEGSLDPTFADRQHQACAQITARQALALHVLTGHVLPGHAAVMSISLAESILS